MKHYSLLKNKAQLKGGTPFSPWKAFLLICLSGFLLVTMLPTTPAKADTGQYSVNIDSTLSNGLIEVEIEGAPPELFVTVKNNSGAFPGAGGLWQTISYETIGNVTVEPLSLFGEFGILAPDSWNHYSVHVEGQGAVTFSSDITSDRVKIYYAFQNFLRLFPELNIIMGETPELIVELAATFDDLREVIESFVQAFSPELGFFERVGLAWNGAEGIVDFLATEDNLAELSVFIWDRTGPRLAQVGIADESMLLSMLKKAIRLKDIGEVLLSSTQMMAYSLSGTVAGSTIIEIFEKPEDDITPRLSVSPESGTPGTRFEVKWTGFSPSHNLAQHLRRKGEPEKEIVVVTTDGQGRATSFIDSRALGVGTYELWGVDSRSGSESNMVEFTVSGEVDLSAYIVSLSPSSVAPAEGFSVTFAVNNHGNSSSGSFSTWVYASASPYGTENLLTKVPFESIGPGNSQTVLVKVVVPSSLASGEYYITAYSDAPGNGVVNESREDNNIGSSTPNKLFIKSLSQEVTLTLYVHENNASGPVISEVTVTGQDGEGNSFVQTTNSTGYVTITGIPGIWSFTASKNGYHTNSWSQSITSTETRHASLVRPVINNAQGIDVSHWQGNIVWDAVRDAGYDFAFVKATEGVGWTDSNLDINMNGASRAGILVGPYHFARPDLGNDPEEEALYFISIADEYIKEGYLRPVLDLEKGASLGKQSLSNWVHDWMNTFKQKTGVEPILYINSDYAKNYLDSSVTQYDLWIAHWTYNPEAIPNTGVWDNWTFWQYSNRGLVKGIQGNVDLDLFVGNRSELNNFIIHTTAKKPNPPTPLSPGSNSSPGPVIDTLTPTLQWSVTSNADYHALAISKYPYGSSNIVYNPQQLYGTSHTVPSGILEYGQKYCWNMQAHNSAGWSDVSATLYFQTAQANITLTLYVHEDSASGPIISGALVTGQDGAGNSFSEVTNSNGYVTITGVPGTWQFTVSKSGYNTNSWSQSITSATTKHAYLSRGDITLTLYVHENSASGSVISGATVTGQDGAGNSFGQVTNSNGYVTITGAPGTWSFTASKSGYETNSWSQSITATDTKHAYLIKPVTDVTLTLYVHENSASGPTVSGATVTGQDGAGNSFSDYTNSNGYVTITGAPGTWSFTASKSGYQINSWSQSISSTSTKHAYLMKEETPSYPPTLIDVGITSVPWPPQVFLQASPGDTIYTLYTFSYSGPNILVRLKTRILDSNGSEIGNQITSPGFQIINPFENPISGVGVEYKLSDEAIPGTYDVKFSIWNEGNTQQYDSVLKSGWLEITSGAVTLTLYVHEDSAGGPIVSGALVTGQDGAGNSFSQVTNSNGYVTITGVPGTWQFTASKSGYDTNSWSQSITANDTKHAYIIKQATAPTSAPTHVSPSNGASGVSTRPTFQWQAVSGATFYGLYVSESPYGEANLVFDSEEDYGSITGTSFTLPFNLEEGITYRWNMRAGNNASWGPFSSSWPFTTSQTAVTLTLYVHENSASGPIISGAAVTGQDGVGNSFSDYTNSNGYVTITGAPGTWSFTASKSGYETNSWSQSITATDTKHAYLVKELALPSSFTLSGQALCDGNNPYNHLSWSSSSGATSYAVYRNGSLYYNLTTLGTTFENTEASSGTTYTYFIRATNAAGSTDSNTITITTRSDCAPAAKFNVGDRVQVTTNLNVRTGPGTGYPEITDPNYPGYAPAGTTGTVLSGPVSANGYAWWQIQYDAGFTGWSAENWLEKV